MEVSSFLLELFGFHLDWMLKMYSVIHTFYFLLNIWVGEMINKQQQISQRLVFKTDLR